LSALDKNNSVIYMSSFSRSLGPGLRLGYVVVPRPLIEAATTIRSLLDNGSPWLEQATLSQFIMDGSFDKHLLKLRHNNQSRRDALVGVLRENFTDVRISGTEAGMHLLWHFDKSIASASDVQAIGRNCGVGVYPLEDSPACYYEGLSEYENVLLLGYNHLDESKIVKGIETLSDALKKSL
jgi:GntR family transcriptional regulator/MocR family aminotransferase